jgi:hypothetical protein
VAQQQCVKLRTRHQRLLIAYFLLFPSPSYAPDINLEHNLAPCQGHASKKKGSKFGWGNIKEFSEWISSVINTQLQRIRSGIH